MAMAFAIAVLVVTPRYGMSGVDVVASDAYSHADGGVRPLGPSVVVLANVSAVVAVPVAVPVAALLDGETANGFVPGTTRRTAVRAGGILKIRSEEGVGRGFDRSLARVDRC